VTAGAGRPAAGGPGGGAARHGGGPGGGAARHGGGPGGGAAAAGWLLLALALGWAAFVHHGIGPGSAAGDAPWWQPRGFLSSWSTLDGLLADPERARRLLSLPSLMLFLGVALLTRSALASLLALSALGVVWLACFYGLGGARTQIWSFFHWRGSAVMVLFSLAVSAALLSPWLARRWLDRGWPLRLALYLPVAALVLVAIRDVTGTDPSLPFAVSPWPIVPLFALETAAGAIASLLAVLGLAAAAVGLFRTGRTGLAVACVALDVALLAVAAGLDFRLGPALFACAAAGALAAWLLPRPRTTSAWLDAARPLGAGAALVALPVLGGQLLVEQDYDETRNEQARRVVQALDAYHARELAYPDSLTELVEAGDLSRVPEPEMGFGWLGEPEFTYQNFGMNYLLEFSAPRWVQCAYNPPYPDEEEDGSFAPVTVGDDGSGDAGDAADPDGGSWSCPQKPPELW